MGGNGGNGENGGKGSLDFSTIPLMTEAQEKALADLLPMVMMGMTGFPLGEAYTPGAYTTLPFGQPYPSGEEGAPVSIGDWTPEPVIPPGDGGNVGPTPPTGPTPPIGGKGEPQPPPMASGGGGIGPALGTILGNPTMPTPETQPVSPVQQALTQPIISPFTQGLTGNFPRRGGRRR